MVSSSDESSTAPSYSSVCHTCKKPHNFTKNICIEHLHIWTLHSNICTYFSILKFSLILPNICIVPKHSHSRNYHKQRIFTKILANILTKLIDYFWYFLVHIFSIYNFTSFYFTYHFSLPILFVFTESLFRA